MTKRIMLLLALTVQSAWAIVNWVAKTDPAQNDIANLDNWPAAIVTDKAIQFNHLNAAAPELWMGQDAAFDRMVLNGTNLVFNLGADRTLTLGQGGETKLNWANTFVRLTSGTIRQTANQLNIGQERNNTNCLFLVDGPTARYLAPGLSILLGYASNSMNCVLGVYNGGNVDGNFYIGNNSFSAEDRVEASGPGTTLWSTNGATFYVGDKAGSVSNRLVLSDSARLVMKGGSLIIGANAGTDRNTAALLSGASATGQSETVIGRSGAGNTLMADQAELRMASLCTIGFYSSGNTVRLTNSVLQSGGIYMGRDSASQGTNALEIIGGTVTNTAGGIRVGIWGNRNTAVISNAWVCPAGTLSVGENGSENSLSLYGNGEEIRVTTLASGQNAGANHNTLRLFGCVITNTGGLGNNGAGNRIEIRDGSRVWSGGGVGGTDSAVSNRLLLTGGSRFTATTAFNFGSLSSFNTMIVDNSSFLASNVTFCLGYTEGTANSNTLAVLNNGYLYAFRLRIGDKGAYNTLIISNATVHAGSENCAIPYSTASTGNRIVFAGTNALLKSEADILIRYGTTLEFIIPRGGYAAPPIQTLADTAKNIYLDPTTRITLDLDAFARGGGGDQVLARTANSFGLSETTLQSLNAQLAPQQCSLEIAGKELILRTPHTGGTVITLQ